MDNYPSSDCRTGRYSAILLVNNLPRRWDRGHADVLVVNGTVLVESGILR